MAKDKRSTTGMGIGWFILGVVLILNNNPAGYAFLVLAIAFVAGPDFPLVPNSESNSPALFSRKRLFSLTLIFFIILTGIVLFLVKS